MRFDVETGALKGRAIFLDGKRVLYPQRGDTIAGTVEAPLIHADGRPVFDYAADDFVIETRRGKITIERDRTDWASVLGAKSEADKFYAEASAGNPFLISPDEPRGKIAEKAS